MMTSLILIIIVWNLMNRTTSSTHHTINFIDVFLRVFCKSDTKWINLIHNIVDQCGHLRKFIKNPHMFFLKYPSSNF